LRIDDDRADFAALRRSFTGVEVAERRNPGCATRFGLLAHALLGFGSQVARVELGDRTHDPVQQHPAGRLVDVLGARHELGTASLEREGDLDVIDAVGLDVRQHPLQFGTVGRAGALARVDELADDLRTESLGLTKAGFALCRDGETFGFAAALGLITGRDAEVYDGSGCCDVWVFSVRPCGHAHLLRA